MQKRKGTLQKSSIVSLSRQSNCKRIRSETGISKGAVSVSQAAVELGRKVFRGLEEAKLILLGAGEMGRLTLDP